MNHHLYLNTSARTNENILNKRQPPYSQAMALKYDGSTMVGPTGIEPMTYSV